MYRRILFVVAVLVAGVFPSISPGMPQSSAKNQSADALTSEELAKVDAIIESAIAKESIGDRAARDQLLEEAASIAGTRHLKLNKLRGLVLEDGQWMTPDEFISQAAEDMWLSRYRKKRQNFTDTLAGNRTLALWCDAEGLENEARAHWLRVLDFDPDYSLSRDRLGHVMVGNRWVTPAQIQAAYAQAEAAWQLLAKHEDEIEQLVRLLESQSQKKRIEGVERLRQIDDSEWIIPLEYVFAGWSEEIAHVVIERLASFDEREATQALMRMAVFNPWPTAREQAAIRLGTRDRFDYVPDMISMLATPVTSQYSIRLSNIGMLYQHVLMQQTAEKDIVRVTGENSTFFDMENDSPNSPTMFRHGRQAFLQARQTEYMKEVFNQNVEEQNRVLIGVLSRALNLDLGDDPNAWWTWWNDENEIYEMNRPMSYENNIVDTIKFSVGGRSMSCLVAGTKIWTSSGLVPVEQLTVGDRVLARDIETGTLSYRPVIRPTIRPPTPTVRISLEGGEVITSSGGHRFWVVDEGWVKARDLTSQMRMETVAGSVRVLSVQPNAEVPLYNLVVDQDANYFVGEVGVLSHDNTIPQSTTKTLVSPVGSVAKD